MTKGPECFENWTAANMGAVIQRSFEYPLFTDARIIGDDLSDGLGPYLIMNAVTMKRGRPALVLYLDQHLTYDPQVQLETDEAAYHAGYLQDEIAALLSLSIGIRLKAGEANRTFAPGDPAGRPISYGFIEDPLPPSVAGACVLPSLTGNHHLREGELIRTLVNLEVSTVTALVRAARLYQEAVWVVEGTPELSWLMLTSAAETVASYWRTTTEQPVERMALSRPHLIELLEKHGGHQLVNTVAEELAPYMGATKTFVDFLLAFLPEPPAERSHEWAQHGWDNRTMKKSLTLIYKYRSRALHGGHPFPAPMCMAPTRVAEKPALVEVPLGLSASSHGATWAKKDTPMLLHVFEYIVRGAVLNWWRSVVQK
jgi:hypothetical protein